jgi:hypothetical protein
VKLVIATSGGIGNIRIHGEVDTDRLDSDLAGRVEAELKPERLETLPAVPAGQTVDATQFEVAIYCEGEIRRYTLDEASAPPEVVEVLQALVRRIIQDRRRR